MSNESTGDKFCDGGRADDVTRRDKNSGNELRAFDKPGGPGEAITRRVHKYHPTAAIVDRRGGEDESIGVQSRGIFRQARRLSWG